MVQETEERGTPLAGSGPFWPLTEAMRGKREISLLSSVRLSAVKRVFFFLSVLCLFSPFWVTGGVWAAARAPLITHYKLRLRIERLRCGLRRCNPIEQDGTIEWVSIDPLARGDASVPFAWRASRYDRDHGISAASRPKVTQRAECCV